MNEMHRTPKSRWTIGLAACGVISLASWLPIGPPQRPVIELPYMSLPVDPNYFKKPDPASGLSSLKDFKPENLLQSKSRGRPYKLRYRY